MSLVIRLGMTHKLDCSMHEHYFYALHLSGLCYYSCMFFNELYCVKFDEFKVEAC